MPEKCLSRLELKSNSTNTNLCVPVNEEHMKHKCKVSAHGESECALTLTPALVRRSWNRVNLGLAERNILLMDVLAFLKMRPLDASSSVCLSPFLSSVGQCTTLTLPFFC